MNNVNKRETEKKLSDIPERTIARQSYSLQSGEETLLSEKFQPLINGKGKLVSYSLYPGVTLSFFDLMTKQDFFFHSKASDSVLTISYCRYGRIEYSKQNNSAVCLTTGDFSVHTASDCSDFKIALPTGYYEGLMIVIETAEFFENPPELFRNTEITQNSIYNKFCTEKVSDFFATDKEAGVIFEAFFDLPKNLQAVYFKLKLQELLLYLYRTPAKKQKISEQYQTEQIAMIKQIHEHLIENMDKRITIDELSKKYLINTTTLKDMFKAVYGVSIAAHMKEHRMKKAALLLCESKKNIEEIARTVGYESQSKFTAAFKSFYESTPLEYRKTHS